MAMRALQRYIPAGVGGESVETWSSRELPILRSLLRRFDAGEPMVDHETIRAELEMPGPQMRAAVTALHDAEPPYIEVMLAGGWGDWRAGGAVSRVYERTRRELGSWPSAPALVDRLAAAIAEAADQEQEPERKSRLRATADTLGGMARDLAVDVLAARLGRID
jgi:hypothetical protein